MLVTLIVISLVTELTPSETVTVAVYEVLVSKSGAALKLITPADEIANSVPDIE